MANFRSPSEEAAELELLAVLEATAVRLGLTRAMVSLKEEPVQRGVARRWVILTVGWDHEDAA